MSGVSTGIGYDAHRFADEAAERLLILGGVEIEGGRGLEAWSDGDVLTHAVIDALLGAAGLGDIGEHFPDTDERWRDAESLEMLRTVAAQVQASGATIRHIDVTVMLEEPKLGPHKDEIRASLAGVLGLGLQHVNVKATRGEGMGFVGRGEGAAAIAIATVERT
jgi:2-C-methyl-D-erythritol 2,4-cyclodiphosphate synthase